MLYITIIINYTDIMLKPIVGRRGIPYQVGYAKMVKVP